MSSILVPQPELPWRVETAFTACGCRMWFWNFPTPPAIGCPAPHTLPQAQIGHVGRLSSYSLHPRGGGDAVGGVVTGPPVWWWLKPPWPRRIGRELGAELRAEALQKGPHPQPSCQLCPIPGPAPAEDRALRRQSPRLSHEK